MTRTRLPAWWLAASLVAPLAAGSTTAEVPAFEDAYEAASAAAVDFWSEWAAAQKKGELTEERYSSTTAADGRVLIWYPKGAKKSKLVKISVKAVKVFDGLFENVAHVEGCEPRSAVLFALAGPRSFASITGHVGHKLPRLAGWAQAAPAGTGFLLEEPLAAGWLEQVPKIEIWSPENELTNRLARLLTLERFGRQPQWLAQGLAWHVELTVCKDVYCFPFRTGFVSKKEHKSWPKKLASLMAARGQRAIEMAELSGWSRNRWNESSAALAWGAATMLAKHYEEELPRVLTALAAERVESGRDVAEDGSWTWIADYEIPAERELEILNGELGVDFLVELGRFANKPKGYRRPR